MIVKKAEKSGREFMYSGRLPSRKDVSYTTKVHDDGREIIHFTGGKQDPDGRRCYCVIFNDMSLNDVMCLTPNQVMMLQIAKGDQISITDWTEFYGMTPNMVEDMEDTKYGVSMQCQYTFNDVLRHNSSI